MSKRLEEAKSRTSVLNGHAYKHVWASVDFKYDVFSVILHGRYCKESTELTLTSESYYVLLIQLVLSHSSFPRWTPFNMRIATSAFSWSPLLGMIEPFLPNIVPFRCPLTRANSSATPNNMMKNSNLRNLSPSRRPIPWFPPRPLSVRPGRSLPPCHPRHWPLPPRQGCEQLLGSLCIFGLYLQDGVASNSLAACASLASKSGFSVND